MLKKRNAQGLSITTIVVAVIGLIVIVVMVALLTGKLGAFSSGVESAVSCGNVCKAIGMIRSEEYPVENACKMKENDGYRYMPGDFSDRKGRACCCKPK